MSDIQTNNNLPINYPTGTPLYNYPNNTAVPQQGSVSVSTPNSAPQIYNYPQTSVYGTPNKQAASGVNIYIYNPSAIGGPTSNSTANATYAMPGSEQQPAQAIAQTPLEIGRDAVNPEQNMTIANTPISKVNDNTDNNNQKTKNIVELTDSYIKTLESYLKSPDKQIRQGGIKEVIKRFEEDDSRYTDPALTALLNIALLDPDASNRLLAISVVAGGQAHGDENTVQLLKQCEQSDKLYGQEALLASKALLKTAETRQTVIDNSPNKKENDK